MKKITLFFSIACIASMLSLTACQKEDVKTSSPALEQDDSGSSAKIINAIDLQAVGAVSVYINGEELLSSLGLGEIGILELPSLVQDVKLDVFTENGTLLVTSVVEVLDSKLLNLVLHLNEGGLPDLSILQIDPADLLSGSDLLGSGLGLDGLLPKDLFGINILDLSSLDVDNLLMELNLLNGDGDIVGGLLEIPEGILSGTILGNSTILQELTLLESTKSLEDLLSDLTGTGSVLDVLNLGDILGFSNIGGSPGNLLALESLFSGLFDGLLGDLLGPLFGGGGSDNPLSVLENLDLSSLDLTAGHLYTLVITGDEINLKIMLIDNNLLGDNVITL